MKNKNLKAQFANSEGTQLLVELTNELHVGDDGWAMIAPMGDHPGMALVDDGKGGFKRVPAIQRLDKKSLTTMANEFEKASKGVKGYLSGRPIYKGHPDVPGYERKYPDKSPVGVFANVQVREDGLYGQPVFTSEGRELVETKKFRALSGRWNAEQDGDHEGKPVFRPTVLLSAGLTNQPNLPVQLLNAKDDDDMDNDDAKASGAADASPQDRAEKLSQMAHDATGKAAAATRKAQKDGSADSLVGAFHAHAAASEAHSGASAAHKEAGCDDASTDHSDWAEDHRGKAVQHLKAAKRLGKETKAEAANEKFENPLIELANKDEVLPLDMESRRGLKQRNATLANEVGKKVTEVQAEKDAHEVTKTQLGTRTKEFESMREERDKANAKFSNERTQHIKTVCDYAIVSGKLAQSERALQEERFKTEASFYNEKQALETKVATKVKTSSVTIDRGGRKIELANATDRRSMMKKVIAELANENKLDVKADYDKLFQMGAKLYPDLFGRNQPEIRRR